MSYDHILPYRATTTTTTQFISDHLHHCHTDQIVPHPPPPQVISDEYEDFLNIMLHMSYHIMASWHMISSYHVVSSPPPQIISDEYEDFLNIMFSDENAEKQILRIR